MQALHKVLNMPEYSGICLNIVWRNCSDYGNVLNMLGQFYSVLNMPQVLNMPISKNGKVVNMQGLHRDYTICLNDASIYVNTLSNAEYVCICLKKTDFWICWNSEWSKVTVQITEQLSRQRRIQNTVKHLWRGVLRKE